MSFETTHESSDNAEAGPSTPRSYHRTPETPTKSRRRSWFGFGGFATPSKDQEQAEEILSVDGDLAQDLEVQRSMKPPNELTVSVENVSRGISKSAHYSRSRMELSQIQQTDDLYLRKALFPPIP